MREYSVNRKNMQFKVFVNEPEPKDFSEITESYKKGDTICEILMGYQNIIVIYDGIEDESGWHIIRYFPEDSQIVSPDTPICIDTALKLFSWATKKNIYRIETDSGKVFYEACRDMSEKKSLYKDLGAKISCEVRYNKKDLETSLAVHGD